MMESPATLNSVPPEIVRHIITELYDCRESLHQFSSCSAVSHIWHELGHPFLFKAIELPCTDGRGSVEAQRTFCRVDALVQLAQMYTVGGGSYDDSPGPLSHVRTVTIATACIFAPAFPRLVELLETQRHHDLSLKIDALPVIDESEVLWYDLGLEQRDALRRLLGFQSEIAFINGTLPISFWGFSSSLKSLDIIGMEHWDYVNQEGVWLDEDTSRILFPSQIPGEDGAAGRTYSPLTHLALTGNTCPCLRQEHPQIFSQLESITLQISCEHVPALWDAFVFLSTQSTVKNTWIYFENQGYTYDSTNWAPLILSDYRGEALYINFNIALYKEAFIAPFLNRTFASLPLQALSELSFDMGIGVTSRSFSGNRETFWPHIIPEFLRELDSAFAPYTRQTANGGLLGSKTLALRTLRVSFNGIGCTPINAKRTFHFGRGGIDIDTPYDAPLIPSISHLVESDGLEFEAVVRTHGPTHAVRVHVGGGGRGERVLARTQVPSDVGESCRCMGPPSRDHANLE